jgi:3-methyladenine DNA glycosylase/8-oxoguanine DNA glycosylase
LNEVIAGLCTIPGLGHRRANYIAMRVFGEPDAFPSSDLGLRRALTIGRTLLSEEEFIIAGQRWQPWRAYAAMHLWAADALKSPGSTRDAYPTGT